MVLGDEILKDVVVKTSHNSYVEGSQQINAKASLQAIENALKNKARAVELDVWYDSQQDKLVVAHGKANEGVLGTVMGFIGQKSNNTYFSNQLDLEECLGTIKEHAFSTTELPLFLFMDIGWKREDKDPFKRLGESLKKVLGDSLLPTEQFDFNKPVRSYSKKIIAMPSISVAQVEEFDCCACWGCYREPFQNHSRPEYDKEREKIIKDDKCLCRIYPDNFLYSGNYDPIPLLNDGIQFVALDFNVDDKSEVNKLDLVFKEDGIVPIKEAREIIAKIPPPNPQQ